MTSTQESGDRSAARPHMHGLASLPVFFDLAGKRVLLAGGSEKAAWKAELLEAAGARVDIFAPAPCADLVALAAGSPAIALFERQWSPADFAGATLAIGDFADRAEAAEFRAAAQAARVQVNVVDQPEFCDFQIGSIIDRSPLVIGISTKGAAPVLALALRGWLEALLPLELRHWAEAAEAWRKELSLRDLAASVRRRFWEVFVARARSPRKPEAREFAEILAAAAERDAARPAGRVALVGAGPGDPELLTLKALRFLQAADVVLFDDLVSPVVVGMARREAVKIAVGKRGYQPSCRQDEITMKLIALAREGKNVVRLKGGDPSVFGRAAEEITALEAAGIDVEVVAGVTAALGAAASLKMSLTERVRARRVQFVTAHARDGRLPEDVDWDALCDPRAATVVYMGVRTLAGLSQRLLKHGIDPQTPALLVERATWPDERRIFGTIADLPEKVTAADPKGPCILFIGHTYDHAARLVEEADPANGSDAKKPVFGLS
jgi:uroporphyrin-III C-methyltransferase / precorrin-2 dehydrogenase / sirohydrochlorin ferrochelatase